MKNTTILFGTIIMATAMLLPVLTGCSDPTPDTSPIVTSVTIDPPEATVARGGTQRFTAVVEGANNPPQTVTWSIVETDKHQETNINADGILTVSAYEALTSLTVRAASAFKITEYDLAVVNVIAPDPSITGVTIEPFEVAIPRGVTQLFTATVEGENNPSQAVTWSIVETGKDGGGQALMQTVF